MLNCLPFLGGCDFEAYAVACFNPIALLIMAAVFAFFPKSGPFNPVAVSNSLLQTDLEYADGTITPENSPLKVWYAWVNVSGTQVIEGSHLRKKRHEMMFVCQNLLSFNNYCSSLWYCEINLINLSKYENSAIWHIN